MIVPISIVQGYFHGSSGERDENRSAIRFANYFDTACGVGGLVRVRQGGFAGRCRDSFAQRQFGERVGHGFGAGTYLDASRSIRVRRCGHGQGERREIEQGTYVVNPEAIADKLLANAKEMLDRTRS